MTLGSTAARTASLKNDFGDDHGTNAPAIWYLAVFHGDPRSGGTELTGTAGIARVAIANSDANWDVTAGVVTNVGTITSDDSTGAWASTGTWAALMDASTAGNLWDVDALGAPISISGSGEHFTANPGDLEVDYAT